MSDKGAPQRGTAATKAGSIPWEGLLVLASSGQVAWADEATLRAAGLPMERVVGTSAKQLLAALGLDAGTLEQVEQALAAGDAFCVPLAPHAELCATPRPDAPGQGRALWFRARGGRSLQEPHLYRTAMEGTSDAVWELDLLAMTSQWGGGMRRLLRVPEDEQDVGVEAWLQRLPPENAARLIDLGRQYREGIIDRHMEEYPIRCYDGAVRWMLDRGCVLERNAEGKPVKVVGVVTDIDRVKRAEDGLARTEHRLAEVFKAFGAAVMLEDEQHRILLVNDAFCALSGFTREELEGGFTHELLSTPRASEQVLDPEAFRSLVAERLAAGIPSQGDRLEFRDGRVMELDYTPITIADDAGGHLWIYRDVTERHRLQAALGSSQRLLAVVIDRIGVGVVLDEDKHIRLANDTFCRIFGTGVEASALVGEECDEAIAGAAHLFRDPEAFQERTRQLKAGWDSMDGELLELVDGRILERDFMPLELPGGRRSNLFTYRDVTERHRLQAELASSQRLLSIVVDRIGVGVVMDEDNRIRLANDTLYKIFGAELEASALEGQDMDEAILRNAYLFRDPQAFVESSMGCKEERRAVDGELMTLADGRIVERDYLPLELPGGRRGNLFTYRDVTERQRMVEELRISGELLTTVIGSIDAALFLEDGQRRVRLANVAFCTMFGIDAEPGQMEGLDCTMAAQAAAALMCDPQGFLAGIEETLRAGAPKSHAELHLLDGRILEQSHMRVWLNAKEEGHLWVYRDVTERHRLEREKRELGERNERLLAAVAQATAGLVRGGPVLEAMRDGLSAVGRATGVDRVYLFENRQDNRGRVRSTSQRYEWNSGSAEPQIDNPDLWDTPVEVFAEILPIMEKGLSWAAHVHEMDPVGLRSVLETQGILSILILPIMVDGRFWGFIGFDQCSYLREWSSNERSILRSLCASVSSALERESLLEQRAHDLAAEQAANRFNQRIMGMVDEPSVFTAIVEELSAASGVDQVSVHVYDPVADMLRCVGTTAQTGPEQAPLDTRALGNGVTAEVVGQRTAHWIYDLRDVNELQGLLLVPVVCEGEVALIITCRMRNLTPDVEGRSRLPYKMADLVAMKLLQLRSFHAAREKDARYRRVIANMQLGLVEVDPDQRIVYVNDTLCEMSAYGREQLIGLQLFEIEGLHASMETFASKRELRSQGVSDAFEVGVTLRTGEERHWFISGAPQFDAEGRYIGSVSVVLDITDRLRMEQDLVAANQKASEALQAKELFLANMSHEMRTPMNAIVGLCNEMLRESSDAVQQSRLSAVIMAGNNLMKLMNDLLDASRAAVGMLTLDRVPMDVVACVRHVETVMRPLALQKGLKLQGIVGGNVAPLFLGDARRIDQVLMNLVGNALKFTPRGRVDLTLEVVAPTANGQRLRFSVRDTGVGIDAAFMPDLFKPFNRDPSQQDLAVEGAGLGLSITKGLVDLMGGTITAESERGRGTTMVVELELPFAKPEGRAPDTRVQGAMTVPVPGIRVLLVEDSAFNRLVVRSMLGGLDLVLQEAEHGVEALAYLCSQDWDIILLDLRMPVMDGYVLLDVLRRDIRTSVPVVVLTAGDDSEQHLLGSGMDAILRKPLEREALLAMLADLVQERGGRRSWRHDHIPEPPQFNVDKVRDMVGGDEHLVSEVVSAFLHDTPGNIASLCAALRSMDTTRIADVAHRIRPSIHMLDMSGVRSIVDDLMALPRTPRPHADVAAAVLKLVRELRNVAQRLGERSNEQT